MWDVENCDTVSLKSESSIHSGIHSGSHSGIHSGSHSGIHSGSGNHIKKSK